MKLEKNLFYRAYKLLRSDQRKKGLGITFLLFVNSVMDFFSLASFLPLILLILNPKLLQTNDNLRHTLAFLGVVGVTKVAIVMTLIVLLFVTLKTWINLWITHQKATYAFGVGSQMASLAITRYLTRSYIEFTQVDFSKELNRISNLPLNFANNILIPAGTLLSEGLVFSMLFLALAVYQFTAFLLLLLILFPAFFIYRNKRKTVAAISTQIGITYPLLLKYTLQMVEGLIDIRSFQKESFFKKRFTKVSRKLSEIFSLDHTTHSGTTRTTELIAAVCICALLLFSLVSEQNQQDTIILLTLYAGASFRIIPSVNRILGALHQIKANEHVVNDLRDMVALEDESFDQKSTALEFKESIELKNISFGYPDQPVLLRQANLKIRKGEKVAITGKSGRGKTSLLLLILQHLDKVDGAMYCDGKCLNEIDPLSWRRLFGYVSQNPYVLDATITENIAFGVSVAEIDVEKVNRLLIDLDLKNWVDSLAAGTNTVIGEKGTKISGGQRQRLAIARALYHEAEILLLDEVTNQLDPKTESEIFDTLKRASADKTIVMITHHPDLLRDFDKIYEVRGGQILEIAAHHFQPGEA